MVVDGEPFAQAATFEDTILVLAKPRWFVTRRKLRKGKGGNNTYWSHLSFIKTRSGSLEVSRNFSKQIEQVRSSECIFANGILMSHTVRAK